ncbi:hypothetical protein N0V83_009390 [Neocucurbitaria cava]|uniref:Polyketide synthase n=1 Tax=Neocucurbitaria cava TaxID=798079 RepID=A0A9W8Y0G7_9PLEO|nr:hypothetical protein N0V83_009390 [Neocucurbitaria cava]
MTASTLPTSLSNARNATSFVFGGHIGPQSKQSLEKHVRRMLDGPNGKWILDTVADFPRFWEAIIEKIPEVAGTMQGARLLADLESWFRHGPVSTDPLGPEAELPDLWLGPLMIAIQLDQYWSYLEFRINDAAGKSVDDPQAELVQQQANGSGKVETVGFCAGMIVATAVASSHSRKDFEKYGATALRIGVLLGALVGACEEWDKGLGKGGSVSLATAWRTSKQGADMDRIVSSLSPDAYVSVLFDDSRATVTSSKRFVPKLIRQLRAAGVTAIPLAFKGKLHTPGEERERHTNALIEMCHAMPELQFPDAACLALPTYMDHPEGKPVSGEEVDLIAMVLRSVLANKLNWAATVSKLAATKEDVSLVAFGLDRPLPPTMLRRFGPKQVQFEDIEDYIPKSIVPSHEQPRSKDTVNDSDSLKQGQVAEMSRPNINAEEVDEEVIAIVGMSLKVAGADDLEEFGEMLKTGASQHELITRERMTHDIPPWRDNAGVDHTRKWYGNFMRDSDTFDHRFFKRSPRESMAIDPQGRHSLQAAYQAVEQSGYFNEMATTSASERETRKHVGVYVGLCSFEYEINTACHAPTAFTATGALRSFIPGRVSHYFGWTGPALTFDTACSSSTVALHNACRDVMSGEVRAALVGGVNVLTNLQWTRNLAAGSFISPTGQCKPFDTDADGYCRGDGIAYVYLKKLSTAIADGNQVLGTIRATGVNQNLNTTPLFVPNVPSLSTLFKDVIRKSHVDPREISLVECHGTGTPVGDPAEYESIRQAVAGPLRDTILPIGSVKGHVGHTEGASGIVSLIKVLTMMRGDFIPPQASHDRMNPHIQAQPSDMMEVVTSLRPWQGDRKFALINNYGACGNNSSAVVAYTAHKPTNTLSVAAQTPRFPFWISGLDARSIAAYSTALAPYLRSHAGPEDGQATLSDVSFNMKRQSNPSLPQGLIFSCSSLAELQGKLSQAALATTPTAASAGIAPVKSERPVILCFGGQVSTFIGLDRALYEGVAVLRHHLDKCNDAITSHGLDSIFPDIFSSEPIQCVVKLQTSLFAMQYASAKSWMDCGLADKIVSVVGHSFGEITALCVAGVLSLEDTVKLIAGRAKLVQEAWGTDSGAMMAIEADEAFVHGIVKEANLTSDGSAGIACFNGPRSFTVAGSTKAIDAFASMLAEKSSMVEGVKSKRLNVTNAFHSALVEPLVDRLGELAKGLTFHDAVVPIERATEHDDSASRLDFSFAGSHMRQPVFFNHAVQRLAKKHPQAIFLEAGSNSTITIMAGRALAQATPTTPDALHFQSVSLTNTKKGIDGLTDATVALWKQGLRVSFWAHHPVQTGDYAQLLLPPYQFEKSRHWLDLNSPTEEITKYAQNMIATGSNGLLLAAGGAQAEQQGQVDPKTLPLWTFLGFQDQPAKKKTKLARFRINTTSDKYQRLFATHVIAETAPIAPATLEIDVAIETLFSLNPEWRSKGFSPVMRDMLSHSPICADSTRIYYIDLQALNKAETEWHFTIHSVGASTAGADEKHAEARINMCSPTDPAFLQEFGRYERVVSHAQCRAVLQLGSNDEGVEALQGRSLYRAFEPVVVFGSVYQGVRSVVGRDDESAGVVQKRHSGDTWLDVPMTDSFGQVAGMYVNLLTDLPAGDMFVATGLEVTMRSPKRRTVTDGQENGPGVWHVLARHTRQSEKAYVTDIFIFDAETGALAEVILGLRYVRIAKATMSKILARMTTDKAFVRGAAASLSSAPSLPTIHVPIEVASSRLRPSSLQVPSNTKARRASSKKPKPSRGKDITEEVRNVVASVSGIEASEMQLDSEMADLGIDSLMGMELAREIESTFKCTLDHAEQMEATNLRQFVACVSNALAKSGGGEHIEQEDDSDDDSAAAGESDIVFSDLSEDEDTGTGISTPDDASDYGSKRLVPSPLPAQASTTNSSAAAAKEVNRGDAAAREAEALRLVAAHTAGWESPALEAAAKRSTSARTGAVVVVTGASGSIGSHLVQTFAEQSHVATVVCVNRPVSNVSADKRQVDALLSRGIELSPTALEKLRVYDTDTSKPQLGLPAQEYAWLAQHGTHIIHNAWPMTATRPLKAFEPQLRVMRNLLDLARDMATSTVPRKVGFQFVSSIGVTGFSASPHVVEQPMPMAAVMPSGYNEGKWVCERMLTETLRQHPRLFRAMVVRPGQISGSTSSGVWNPVEHFPFIVKSAQALQAFPDLQGVLHWLPVDRCAGVMVDLLKIANSNDDPSADTEAYPVYHVDNPVGQPWKDMSAVLAAALDIHPSNIVPFEDWVERVRRSPLSPAENPAAQAIHFLEGHFERMACGGIILDTKRSGEHSQTMAAEGPVSAEVVRSYVSSWKTMGFLR